MGKIPIIPIGIAMVVSISLLPTLAIVVKSVSVTIAGLGAYAIPIGGGVGLAMILSKLRKAY